MVINSVKVNCKIVFQMIYVPMFDDVHGEKIICMIAEQVYFVICDP